MLPVNSYILFENAETPPEATNREPELDWGDESECEVNRHVLGKVINIAPNINSDVIKTLFSFHI